MSGWKFNLEPVDVPEVETKYRKIVTKIPVPESLDYFKVLDEYETRAMHGQMPVVWDRAEGFQVSDAWGNTWIDFTSTIFVANAGHGNVKIINAVRKQLDKPLLHTYAFASKIRADYLKYLISVTPRQFEKAFLLSAGTEATECALKLMRMNGQKNGKRRPGIIAFEGNWHGRTLGAQMMGYNSSQKEWIGYLDPNIHHLPFPYPWRNDAMKDPAAYFRTNIEKLIAEKNLDPDIDLCGFILETFQGWGAVFYPKEFVCEISNFAKEHGMLVTFDEMQAGFGRTGKLFGYMHYEVEPDILCCGKGISSGFPLSAVLGSKEVMDLPDVGSMSSTHSANPISCAVGMANLKTLLEEGLIEKSRVLGGIFLENLNQLRREFPQQIKYVLGEGLLAAVHFVDPNGKPLSDFATRVCESAMKKGLLVVHTGRESIKLAPPFCITEEALLEGIGVLREAIREAVLMNTTNLL